MKYFKSANLSKKGYTLIELLVAAAISFIVILAIGSSIVQFIKLSKKEHIKLKLQQDARYILEIVINGMITKKPTNEYGLGANVREGGIKQASDVVVSGNTLELRDEKGAVLFTYKAEAVDGHDDDKTLKLYEGEGGGKGYFITSPQGINAKDIKFNVKEWTATIPATDVLDPSEIDNEIKTDQPRYGDFTYFEDMIPPLSPMEAALALDPMALSQEAWKNTFNPTNAPPLSQEVPPLSDVCNAQLTYLKEEYGEVPDFTGSSIYFSGPFGRPITATSNPSMDKLYENTMGRTYNLGTGADSKQLAINVLKTEVSKRPLGYGWKIRDNSSTSKIVGILDTLYAIFDGYDNICEKSSPGNGIETLAVLRNDERLLCPKSVDIECQYCLQGSTGPLPPLANMVAPNEKHNFNCEPPLNVMSYGTKMHFFDTTPYGFDPTLDDICRPNRYIKLPDLVCDYPSFIQGAIFSKEPIALGTDPYTSHWKSQTDKALNEMYPDNSTNQVDSNYFNSSNINTTFENPQSLNQGNNQSMILSGGQYSPAQTYNWSLSPGSINAIKEAGNMNLNPPRITGQFTTSYPLLRPELVTLVTNESNFTNEEKEIIKEAKVFFNKNRSATVYSPPGENVKIIKKVQCQTLGNYQDQGETTCSTSYYIVSKNKIEEAIPKLEEHLNDQLELIDKIIIGEAATYKERLESLLTSNYIQGRIDSYREGIKQLRDKCEKKDKCEKYEKLLNYIDNYLAVENEFQIEDFDNEQAKELKNCIGTKHPEGLYPYGILFWKLLKDKRAEYIQTLSDYLAGKDIHGEDNKKIHPETPPPGSSDESLSKKPLREVSVTLTNPDGIIATAKIITSVGM
ncbi:MAG: type II secretion system protein [bacterium]